MTISPDPDLTPQDVLILGAAFIHVRGLAKDAYQDKSGRICALGAIGLATSGDPRYVSPGPLGRLIGDAQKVLRRALRIRNPISAWNDHPERTAPEVVRAMLSAAGVR